MALAPAVSKTELGAILLRKIAAYCRSRGTGEMVGFIRKNDEDLLRLVRASGCTLLDTEDPKMLLGHLKLQETGMEAMG